MNQHSNILNLDRPHWRRPEAQRERAQALLSVEDLRIEDAGGRPLVDGVSFDIKRGGTIGIVGESGSGKSLTCRAILGVLPKGLKVASGTIRYRNSDLVGLSARDWRELRGVHLSAVFQDPASYLNPSIPVGVQLAEALRATLYLDRRTARERAVALLARVGLSDAEAVYRQYPHELSGGMAQRVLIAIAVSGGPQLLIADEATTALDVTVQAEVLALLDELRREQGLTLILVSHDLAVVSKVCENVIVMRHGVVVEAGPTRDVLRRPAHPYTQSLIENHRRYAVEERAAPAPLKAVPAQPDPLPPLLAIENMTVGYGARQILDGIDLDIEKGEILGLIGETGSGKTTILKSILGLVPP
ncbi:MAG: ATP-binding cassette domain-containing protein, partial [Sphingobium sp.]